MINYIDNTTERFINEWYNDKAYINAHTSGSTGSPKTIHLLKKDMMVSAISTCRYFNINGKSLMVCPLSADYIAGKMMIVRSIVSGATLHMIKPSNHPDLQPYPHIDLLPIVPSQLSGLMKGTTPGLIDNVIIGGAPLTPVDEISLHSAPFTSYATYGMTETCSHVALRPIVTGNNTYEALPGYTFDTDTRSCLIIHSDIQSFGTLITNDVVQLIDKTHFIWQGRFDNVIISGGLKIHPEIIERTIGTLLEHNFYITSAPDQKWGQHVVLVIEGKPFDCTSLQEVLRQKMKPHELPREIIFKNTFRRTASGKIIR